MRPSTGAPWRSNVSRQRFCLPSAACPRRSDFCRALSWTGQPTTSTRSASSTNRRRKVGAIICCSIPRPISSVTARPPGWKSIPKRRSRLTNDHRFTLHFALPNQQKNQQTHATDSRIQTTPQRHGKPIDTRAASQRPTQYTLRAPVLSSPSPFMGIPPPVEAGGLRGAQGRGVRVLLAT